MSAFYGSIQGNRGEATRGGSKKSGFKATCQSYDGSVIVNMWYDENDNLQLSIGTSNRSSAYRDSFNGQFSGSFEELKTLLKNYEDNKRRELKDNA